MWLLFVCLIVSLAKFVFDIFGYPFLRRLRVGRVRASPAVERDWATATVGTDWSCRMWDFVGDCDADVAPPLPLCRRRRCCSHRRHHCHRDGGRSVSAKAILPDLWTLTTNLEVEDNFWGRRIVVGVRVYIYCVYILFVGEMFHVIEVGGISV